MKPSNVKDVFHSIFLLVMILVIVESISALVHYHINKGQGPLLSIQSNFINYKSQANSQESLIPADEPISKKPLVRNLKLYEVEQARLRGQRTFPWYVTDPQLQSPDLPYFLANVPNSEIVWCDEAGEFNRWQSDELGFRNPRQQIGNEVDILLVGDSMVEGACENEPDTIADVIRSYDRTVFNISRGGSGPLFQLATLREYGGQVSPEKVVWVVFTGNDLQNLREEKGTLLSLYLTNEEFSQQLAIKNEEVGLQLEEFLLLQMELTTRRLEQNLPSPYGHGYGETLDFIEAKEKEAKLLGNIADKFLEESAKLNAELLVVLINHPNPKFDFQIQDVVSQTINSFCAENELSCYEFDRHLLSTKTGFFTSHFHHFNSDGYNWAGGVIADFLN